MIEKMNDYRDEAGEFLRAIGAEKEDISKLLRMLDEEMLALKRQATSGERAGLAHQTYDVLFLLLELAARFDLDLDAEWAAGRMRKQEKYLAEKELE